MYKREPLNLLVGSKIVFSGLYKGNAKSNASYLILWKLQQINGAQ
jgi:hypothetical protein